MLLVAEDRATTCWIHVHFLVAAIGGYSVLGGDDIVFLWYHLSHITMSIPSHQRIQWAQCHYWCRNVDTMVCFSILWRLSGLPVLQRKRIYTFHQLHRAGSRNLGNSSNFSRQHRQLCWRTGASRPTESHAQQAFQHTVGCALYGAIRLVYLFPRDRLNPTEFT